MNGAARVSDRAISRLMQFVDADALSVTTFYFAYQMLILRGNVLAGIVSDDLYCSIVRVLNVAVEWTRPHDDLGVRPP